ncbi:MAG: hypothetical protein GY940_29925 [bacterium]|nr:hypothetical protein [bacterium]
MKKLILILMLVICSVAFLSADVYVKSQMKTSAAMGQAAQNIMQEIWMGDGKVASINPSQSFILDKNKNKAYMVIHNSKSYVETDLPLDMTKIMPPQVAQVMKGMMSGMSMTVEANGQTKKIMDMDANGYDVSMKMMGMDMKMTIWASPDVPFDWKKYADLYSELFSAQFRLGEKVMSEFKKVKGFQMQTEMSIMGMKMNNNVIEINANKSPGPGVYSIPAEYTKKETLSMADLQNK